MAKKEYNTLDDFENIYQTIGNSTQEALDKLKEKIGDESQYAHLLIVDVTQVQDKYFAKAGYVKKETPQKEISKSTSGGNLDLSDLTRM